MSFSFPHLLSLSYRRIPSVLLSLIIITVFFSVFAISKATATTVPTCSTDALENLIEAAEPGTTIKVPGGCIYRETVDVKKSVTLDGQGVAEIRGSDVWTGWTKVNGVDRWTKASTNATDFQQFGECKSNTDNRCKKRL